MPRIEPKTREDLPEHLKPLWDKMLGYGDFADQAGAMAHRMPVFEKTWDDPIPGMGSMGAMGAYGGGGGRLGNVVSRLTRTRDIQRKLNRSGRGDEWQKFKRFVQAFRRNERAHGRTRGFKRGMKAYEKKYGKLEF